MASFGPRKEDRRKKKKAGENGKEGKLKNFDISF